MGERYLVLDSRVIKRAENARLRVFAAERSAANPLFGEDRPWEARFDNLYPNVFPDEEEGVYRCWYSPFCVDYPALGMSLEERRRLYDSPPGREMGICYATSADGLEWRKPELGLVDFRGSTANNLLLRGPHGAGIFKDPRETDPARRYKMIASREEQEVAVAFSGDGVHWGPLIDCPQVNPYPVDGTHYHALWVEERGEYAGFTRLRDPRPAGAPAQPRPRGAWPPRQVGRAASRDFVHWTPASAVLEGIDEHLQIYSMPVFRHGGVYLGLPAVHDQRSDRVWTELAWSADTVRWQRVCPGSPVLANADLVGSYDWGCAYAALSPVVLPHEIRLYYGASNYLHTGWRDGFLCLATLRPDGFAGYEQEAGDRPASVLTAPLTWSGAALRVSADLSPLGALEVAVLAAEGDRVLARGQVDGTVTDGPVRWRERPPEAIGNRAVRLRLTLDGARLYSFSFADSP